VGRKRRFNSGSTIAATQDSFELRTLLISDIGEIKRAAKARRGLTDMDRAEMLWKEVLRLTEVLKQKDEEIRRLKEELAGRPAKE
jgi:hypothetical protein